MVGWVVLMILVSSPVQSFEIWSSTGLSLDNLNVVSYVNALILLYLRLTPSSLVIVEVFSS